MFDITYFEQFLYPRWESNPQAEATSFKPVVFASFTTGTYLLIRWVSNPRTLGFPRVFLQQNFLPILPPMRLFWCRYFRFFLLKTLRFLHLEKVNHILGGQDGVLAVCPKTPSVKPFEAPATSLFRTMPNLLSISHSIVVRTGIEPVLCRRYPTFVNRRPNTSTISSDNWAGDWIRTNVTFRFLITNQVQSTTMRHRPVAEYFF